MRWVSFGSLNSSMSRSLKSGRHPGGTTMKLPASVPVVRYVIGVFFHWAAYLAGL